MFDERSFNWFDYEPEDGFEPLQLVFGENVYSDYKIVTDYGLANPKWISMQEKPLEWEHGVLFVKGEPITLAALEALEAAGISTFSVRLTHVVHGAI